MKITILLFLSISFECLAQNIWTRLEWPFQGIEYTPAIHFINETEGYVLGENSLFFSSNGGVTWQQRTLPKSYGYNIHFFDVQKGLLSTDDGRRLFKTSDGGFTWEEIDLNIKDSMNARFSSFNFIENTSFGYIVTFCTGCSQNVLPYTTDGGNTWKVRYFDFSTVADEIQFKSPEIGIGIFNNLEPTKSFLAVTTDSGAHWVRTDNGIVYPPSYGYRVTIKYLSNGQWLASFYYENDKISVFYKSEDDGVWWDFTTEIQWDVSSTEFYDATGYATAGYIWSTTDFGETWDRDSIPKTEYFSSFSVPSANVAYVVGETQILKLSKKMSVFEQTLQRRIYPNPSQDFITFDFEEAQDTKIIEVFDALGRRMSREMIAPQATSHQLDVRSYPPGVYIVRIGEKTIRFIKE